MGFVFRFQKIMDIKDNEKEEAKMEYANSLLYVKEQEEELDHLLIQQEFWKNKWEELGNQAVPIQNLLEIQGYVYHLSKQIEQKKNRILHAKQEAESLQQILIDKTKELQVWEKWKEKGYSEYQEEERYREQKLMDELGLQQFVRGGGNNIGGNR